MTSNAIKSLAIFFTAIMAGASTVFASGDQFCTYNPTSPLCPTISLSVNRTSAVPGDLVTFTWSSNNAERCYINSLPVALSGQKTDVVTLDSYKFLSYALVCANGVNNQYGVGQSRSVSVAVPPVSINSFVTSNATPLAGNPVTINWNTSNASSCYLQNSFSSTPVPVNGTKVYTVNASSFYSLICKNGQSTQTKNMFIAAIVPQTTPITFYASSYNPAPGLPVILTWSAPGASSCTLNGLGLNVSVLISGSYTVANPQTGIYTINCIGLNYNQTKSLNITTQSAGPIINSFTANTQNIAPNGTVVFSYTSQNTQSCSIMTSYQIVAVPVNGSYSINLPSSSYVNLICRNSNGLSATSPSVLIKTY